MEVIAVSSSVQGRHNNRVYIGARVRNRGAAAARHVRVWIVDGDDDTPIGYLDQRHRAADVTIEAKENLEVEMNVGAAMVTTSLRYRLAWRDDLGEWVSDGPMCPRRTQPHFDSALIQPPDAKPKRPGKPPPGV